MIKAKDEARHRIRMFEQRPGVSPRELLAGATMARL
jgi:hypothetical protein